METLRKPASKLLLLTLFFALVSTAHGGDESPYIYSSRENVPRHLSFVTDNPKFNRMWTETIIEILSRQLANGQLIESSVESGLYPNSFPRSVTPVILIKSGYLDQARKRLDFLWDHQKKNGSFWNFHDREAKGGGIVEEDGGCYVVGQTYLYYLYSGDRSYLEKRWSKTVRSMNFLEDLFDKELNLFYSTAGYSEGNIRGGYNIYHQAISAYGFRSAAGIALALGKDGAAGRYTSYVEKVKKGVYENLYNREKERFSFQRSSEGGFFDPPYPAFLVLSYYDILDPREKSFENSFTYMMEGPRFGVYRDEIFGLEPFDHNHSTGRGFWLGQNGHGWVIPYLLKAGRMEEADDWIRSLISMTDEKTFLVPEHINWSHWDPDGGEWAGKKYGVYPEPSAWVDPGNLYALSTAMHMVFTIVDADPGDPGQTVYFRVPPSFGMVAVTNLRSTHGYIDASFVQYEGSVKISIAGEGEGKIVIVGHGETAEVERDGILYDRWVIDQNGDLDISTDFELHKFVIHSGE